MKNTSYVYDKCIGSRLFVSYVGAVVDVEGSIGAPSPHFIPKFNFLKMYSRQIPKDYKFYISAPSLFKTCICLCGESFELS